MSTNSTRISISNSTTTALGASESFIGAWEVVYQYSSITVAAETDQNTLLYIDFSLDGTNIFKSHELSPLSTTLISETHTFIPETKFMRVRAINDETPQTYLRIQTIFDGDSRIALHSQPNYLDVSRYQQSVITKAILVCDNGNGSFVNVKSDQYGQLITTPHTGTHNNAFDDEVVTASDTCSSIDLEFCKDVAIYGTSTASLNLIVEVSPNAINYYDTHTSITTGTGEFYSLINFPGRYLRLRVASGNGIISCTVSGK
jgi:hypothetical protein